MRPPPRYIVISAYIVVTGFPILMMKIGFRRGKIVADDLVNICLKQHKNSG